MALRRIFTAYKRLDMIRKFHITLIYLVLFVSIAVNLLLWKDRNLPSPVKERDGIATESGVHIEKKHSMEYNSVYVMPHPPNFLEGRRIIFQKYAIEEKEGKRKILFLEKIGRNWQTTEVDSEAVRWK
jgi:hypothetical protein